MRYFLRLAYDGTPFHGWQRQPNASSVQQTLEEAISTILRKETVLTGAGRTDAGVHAREMFAHFDCETIQDKHRFLTSLNRMAGNAIAVYDLLPVSPEAHARFDAVSRSYEYHITLKKNPFDFNFAHRMERLPDVEAMNQGGRLLEATADFTSFAKLHADTKTNICKVSRAVWEWRPEEERLIFSITADRFLRNMVRAVVGTLLEVGQGKMNLRQLQEVIEKKDRCSAGVSMPAKGLFLTGVEYPTEIFI